MKHSSMYEDLEKKRNSKIKTTKIIIGRILAIILGIGVLLVLFIFLRLSKPQKPQEPIINNDLPVPISEYNIPSNPNKEPKVNDVLFFYDNNKLLGTYKCLEDCNIAISSNEEPLNMAIIDKRYVFIKEIDGLYLYDIISKRYLGLYQDIKYSKKDNDLGIIDSSKYMVKKDGYWGLDMVLNTTVTNLIPFSYNDISYYDNNTYILQDKDNLWLTYDYTNQTYTIPINDKITSIYSYKGDKYLINNNLNKYKIYLNGNLLLERDNMYDLKFHHNFLTYLFDNHLYIIDYYGNNLIEPLILYNNLYNLDEENDILKISTPHDNTTNRITDEYFYNKDNFTLIKKRLNIKEMIE